MADRRRFVTAEMSRMIEQTIYTDWANRHLDKTGIKRFVQDLPKDISDGILLADIVYFVCGHVVERIHKKPRTVKQKLHNISRCLQVLQCHNVIFCDVTAQGLYRGELNTILALFYHLTRYMKKVEDTNMADVVKTNQRRGIRPPSTITRPPSAVTVSRKSKSFNANDRIQVNIDRKDGGDVTVSSPLNFNMVSGGKASQSRINAPASVSCTTGWRSKSMNAKHSATTRLVPPKPHTMTFQTFKPERPLSSNASMTSQSSDSQSVVSRDERNIKMKAMNTAEARQHRHRPLSAGSKSDLRTTINNNSLSRNRNVTNKSSLTRQTSNKRTITSTSPVPVAKPAPTKLNSTKTVVKDPKPTQNGVKSTASVMSRLRKLGTTSPNNTSSTSASKNVVSSSATSLKKRADSCPPTSRLGTMIPNMTQQTKAPPKGHINEEKKTNVKTSSDTTTSGIKTSSKVKTSSVVKTSSTVKSSSGIKSVKSTIGKAFGGARQNDKKKPPSSSSTLTGLFNKSKKAGILKSEICPIIPMATEDNSNSSTLTSQQALTPHQTSSVINGSIGPFDSKKNDGITPPALNDILDDDGSSIKPISFTSCGGENNIRNTAIVTPFKGQFNLDHQTSTPKPSAMQKSQSSTSLGMRTSNKKDQLDDAANDAEARDVVVKGIANLRQNLEETMFSLRNTQLRHRGCDAFQRRISAQVDRAEFNEFRKSLPSDSTLSSNSNSIYRSHHNLMWGRTSVGHITCNALNSNKSKVKNYRESLDDEEQSAVKDQFSSLQRTRSVCCPRTAWHDVTDDGDLNESDELAEDMEKPRYVSSILKDHDLESEKWNHKIDRSDDTVNNSFETSSNVSTSIFEENTPQPSQYRRHHQELPIGKLGSRLSKSTMAIESSGKSVKFAKTKGFGKSERSIPGSSIVGSRLASNTVAYTPEHGGSLSFTTGLRENVFYQSLPRPNKSKLHDGTENNATNQSRAAGDGSHLPHTTAMTKVNNFKRSPSLQKLFGFGKSKQNPDVAMITSSSPVTVSTSYVVTSQPQSTRTWTNCQKFSSSSDLNYSLPGGRGFENYNSLELTCEATFTTSPSTYMSLPRTVPSSQTLATIATTTCSARPLSTMTTWSTSCNEPNNNYSVSPPTSNPFMDLNLLSSPSLYLDEESGKIAAESLVKQAAEFGKCDVSDWPLPTLYSSSKIARSIPNMQRKQHQVRYSSRTPAHYFDKTQNQSHKTSSDDNFVAFNDSGATSFNLPAKETYHGSECDLSDQKRGFFTADNCSHSVMSSTTSLYSMKSNLENIREDSKSHNHHNRKTSMTSSMQSIPSTKMRFMQFTEEEKNKELQNMRNKFETLKRNPSPDGWSNGSCGVKNKASCGSLSSITSSIGSTEDGQRRRKKHWLKDSIKTAFSKRKSRPNLINEIEEEKTFDDTSSIENKEEADVVAHLKEELLMKERKLTDIRLEALTSQHQLHQMQDAMQKMKSEMETLRQENERLNRLGSSNINIASISSDVRRFTQQEKVNHMKNCDVRMKVVVEFPQHTVHDDTDERSHYHQILIGSCYVPRSSGWQQLDKKVQRAFEEYCQHMDPSFGLGLTPDSVVSFIVGDFIRFIEGETPDLLPCAYIIGDVDTIIIKLKDGNTGSVDSLALELLIDHDTVKRYTQLVLDHGRVMLCGPAGTGKSTLANRLAEHVVRMTLKRSGLGAIVKLDLKQRNEIEISEYLHQLSEDCSKPESCGREIPVVLILDGIHRSSLLQDAFTPLLATAAHSQLPYLIGVAGQNCLSGLELHQEFRWILCSNHTPPVSEFLERSLRKTMLSWQATHPCSDDDVLNDVIYWLPQCWRHINSFIEAYNSADVTLGPRLFTTCPMDEVTSKAWFTDLWNFSVVPYVISAVKQGCKSSMKQWRDPVEWIKQSWPWREPCDLLAIRPEDVCIDSAKSGNDITVATVRSQLNDPLLSMFLKLQETTATNCASNVPRDDINKVDTFERTLDRALGDLP